MAKAIKSYNVVSSRGKYLSLKAMGITLLAAADAAAARALLELDDNLADLTAAEVAQLEAIGATTISAAQWALLGGLAATAVELAQLEAIGATTISAAQWVILGALAEQAEITDELTTITHTAPGTPDYAVQNLTTTTPYGFVTQDEGNTVLSVIANLQARVNELEAALTALNLLADVD
uniref:Uncharacterized protein n=1 Tax=viral metagenome TaxID=1070528 RepID=A0A6M3JDU8_9ZZZZ